MTPPSKATTVTVPEPLVREQLETMLAHESFSKAPVLSEFLRFIVNQTLQGNGLKEDLKEDVIRTMVFRRKVNVSSPDDTVVRGAARRLRVRLHEYFSLPLDHKVVISLNKGGYVPTFASVDPPLNMAESDGPPDPVAAHALDKLQSTDAQVRVQAIETLRERAQGNAKTVARIIELLLDPDLRVSTRAAAVMAEWKPASAKGVNNLILLLNTRRDDSEGHLKMAAEARSVAAHALGAIGPPAKAAAPELLRRLENDLTPVREEAVKALVGIGSGDDPRVMIGLIKLVCDGSQVAASLLLQLGATVANHVPALVEALRETTGKYVRREDATAAQAYILEILLHTGAPDASGVEQVKQYMAGASAEEQASVALAWLELDAQAKDRIRNLIRTSGAGAILKEGLDSRHSDRVPVPNANSPLGRTFWSTQRSEKAVRCAACILMLGLEGSEKAWPLLTRALTGEDRYVATYAAIVLGKLDPAVACTAVAEIVAALRQCNADSWNVPAICNKYSDTADPQAALINSLTMVGDGTTIQMLEPFTEPGSPPCTARIAREVIAGIQERVSA